MGSEADYFLYPKLDVEKRSAKPLSTPLRSKTAYGSVDALWKALRLESSKNLARIDNNAPRELKTTYRAYIREFMKNQDAEDQEDALNWGLTQVPDLEALLDNSRMRKITDRRRKTQVMFRSSIMNEERAKILLHSNPLPEMNDQSGNDGIIRFLPPVENCYKRQLVMRNTAPDDATADDHDCNNSNETRSVGVSNGREFKTATDSAGSDPDSDFDEQDLETCVRNEMKPVKCVFLTEADASAIGTFSRKRRELMDAKAIDVKYSQGQETSREPSVTPPRHHRIQEASSNSSEKKSAKKKSEAKIKYQPLTLGALMEYATKYSAPGEGGFKFGARPMWTVQ